MLSIVEDKKLFFRFLCYRLECTSKKHEINAIRV